MDNVRPGQATTQHRELPPTTLAATSPGDLPWTLGGAEPHLYKAGRWGPAHGHQRPMTPEERSWELPLTLTSVPIGEGGYLSIWLLN